jgi:hypothetical protein
VELAPNGDPECAQKAVDCGAGERGDERVREVAREGLLREGAVGVVEACIVRSLVSENVL